MTEQHLSTKGKLDAEELAGHRFPYQEDVSLVEDIDLIALTPGQDLNWLEDVSLLEEDGAPAVFDRFSNSFLKIYFPIPAGREDELARKVLMTHLTSGNSYGYQLKPTHAKWRTRRKVSRSPTSMRSSCRTRTSRSKPACRCWACAGGARCSTLRSGARCTGICRSSPRAAPIIPARSGRSGARSWRRRWPGGICRRNPRTPSISRPARPP